MPVACLDLGGPKDIVTPQSGVIVNTGGLTTAQVAARLADQLYETLCSPTLLAHMSAGAIDRANEFLVSDQVTKLYQEASRFIAGGSKSVVPGRVNAPVGPVELAMPAESLPRQLPQVAD